MPKKQLQKIAQIKGKFDREWRKLSPSKKAEIEKRWDIEHAYYSSTMEGNGLDKRRFKELAKAVK